MYAPGIKSEYSGGGTTISQVILIDVTSDAYDRWMGEHVLQPMGMTESFYTQPPPVSRAGVLAAAYHEDGSPVPGKYHIYPEKAAAGLWTNPTDLCKYIIETQLSLAGRSAKVLDAAHTKLRLTPYIDSSAALGVFIVRKGDRTWFQHNGADEGFRAAYYGSLEGGNGVVVMANTDNWDILNEVLAGVATVYRWKGF
jgi:CubicO group peptidase (beta-lactamase class C family)